MGSPGGLIITINRETFTGLNFCGIHIHSIWIFVVTLSWYKAREQYMLYLEQRVHRKTFCTSVKKPFSPEKLSPFMVGHWSMLPMNF